MDCYKRPKYDVFVNYASEDIGKRFVSHLKGALIGNGFSIADHTMLPLGQDESSELLKAIEDSEIYLVVFSGKYASSVRCLEEFALIMETYPKFKKRKVFPVFFDVEPSHVRNQQGSFLEAFQGHEKNVDAERVQIWRQALKEAGDKSGLNLKDWRHEEQLIRNIIKDVRKMQNPQQLCYVEHPVGIDSREQDIFSALRLTDQAFSIVAVLGISGSGKTTIVKAVYDKIAADFDVSCFIENIHGLYTGRNWEVKLQRDAIYRLTAGKNKFKGSDGVAKLIKLLSGQKVLLILDDVYEFKQLQALSIHLASFHYGSRIIVTTRNKLSLSNLPHTPYNIRLLDTIESFELFTRLIGKGDPLDKKFVGEIVRFAGGIPLVLEVWSRHFRDYERKLWPSMLETLKRIPHEDTQKKLQISYDSLHPNKRAQNLFLDVACFFHGMSIDFIVKVLQDDLFPDVEIQIQKLVHRFLFKYENAYRLSMHNVIKEMGQEVVRQENEEDPGKRTRLMDFSDVVRVFGDCSGTDSVRSIKLNYTDQMMKEKVTVQLEAVKQVSNVRYIRLANPNLRWLSSSNDDMPCFSFKHLKYLEWDWFPFKSLDNIDMGNVVVIRLYKSKLEKLWEGVKIFKKLKILHLSTSSSLSKTGNFIGLENLEELDLSHCENLEDLDSSIGCLQKLAILNLSYCTQLKRLPWKIIGKLTSLQQLHLDRRPNLLEFSDEVDNLKSIRDLPPSINELQFITELELDTCLTLDQSEGFTQVTGLRNLQILHMTYCNVSQVSCRIGNLVSLVSLDLSGNTFSSLPDSFSNLSKLEELTIRDCSQLRLLPLLPSQLENIEATDCWSLDVMPFDSTQNAYIFRSKAFKESLTSTEGLHIVLSGEELPDWCTYRNSGNALSFVPPIQFDHNKICGLILCTLEKMVCSTCYVLKMHNKTKGTSHDFDYSTCYMLRISSMLVMFYPLDDTTLVVEAGDTVEVEFNDEERVKSAGLRLVYEDDVVDSGLVLKDVRKPTLSRFPISVTELNDEDA